MGCPASQTSQPPPQTEDQAKTFRAIQRRSAANASASLSAEHVRM
ncbi:hypothetical protein [Polaromonas sp. CG9_12]|nr:hypothetical protein [Polaromonas sp. CG9_12]